MVSSVSNVVKLFAVFMKYGDGKQKDTTKKKNKPKTHKQYNSLKFLKKEETKHTYNLNNIIDSPY